MANPPSPRELADELRRHLSWHESEGTTQAWRDAKAQAPVAVKAQVPAAAPAAQRTPVQAPVAKAAAAAAARPQAPESAEVPVRTLDEIRLELGDCKRCKLCQGRTQIVFGAGNPKASLVFVGEGPGADEDAQGIPFVGKAGQLLTKMIEAMKFRRDEVYICNVVKCRPPGNRNPEPEEIAACEPFLKAQLASLKPQVIVGLGKFAVQTLLREETAISRLRGQWREYQGIPLMPTFHPAYLLRTPEDKKLVWADLQLVMKRLGKL
ncbi:MAG: uracil-DNA glycosylase [Myxococcaceae bacterium]|nr:uracil-DNA glycosylase [Myxococcaceae bacterium]